MADYTKSEISAGIFVILGLIALGYLSVSIGGLSLFPPKRYVVTARFASIGDLKSGATVKIAGVTVGDVRAIRLSDYVATADLAIDQDVKLPSDTIASVRQNGLLGDEYVSLSPGASTRPLRDGGAITQTEPALDVTELLGKYAFGSRVPDAAPAEKGSQHEAQSPFSNPLQ